MTDRNSTIRDRMLGDPHIAIVLVVGIGAAEIAGNPNRAGCECISPKRRIG
jgi:hypothetical protein